MKLGINPAEGHRLQLSGILFSDDEDITATDVNNANREYSADHRIRKNTESAHYTFDSPTSDLVNLSATVYRDDTEVTDDGKDYDRITKAELTTTGADIFNTFDFKTGWAQHAFTLGTEYYHDAGEGRVNGSIEPQNPKASQDVVGVYAQYRMTLFDQLNITPGVRWDYYATNPEGGDFENRHNDRVSPKVGVDWRPLDWVIAYGSYSQGYRAPSIRELYISGTHFAIFPGADNTFVPNPNLKPESTRTWEGGLRFAFDDVVTEGDALRINGSYYDTRAKNFIEGDVVMDFATFTFTTTPVNVPRAHIRGGEIELAYDSEYAFFNGGWSRIRGDNLTDNVPLTSIPADKLFVTVGAKVPQLDVFFGMTDEYAWGQHRIADDPEIEVDHYNVVGLFAGWAPDEGLLKGFRIDAGIDNLFNKQYERYLALGGRARPRLSRRHQLRSVVLAMAVSDGTLDKVGNDPVQTGSLFSLLPSIAIHGAVALVIWLGILAEDDVQPPVTFISLAPAAAPTTPDPAPPAPVVPAPDLEPEFEPLPLPDTGMVLPQPEPPAPEPVVAFTPPEAPEIESFPFNPDATRPWNPSRKTRSHSRRSKKSRSRRNRRRNRKSRKPGRSPRPSRRKKPRRPPPRRSWRASPRQRPLPRRPHSRRRRRRHPPNRPRLLRRRTLRSAMHRCASPIRIMREPARSPIRSAHASATRRARWWSMR